MSVESGCIELSVQSRQHTEAIDVTSRIEEALPDDPAFTGVNLWAPHTTAGITVNESADPAIMADLTRILGDLVPWDGNYDHIEDNAAAHIKSILLGSHQWLPLRNQTLDLGRWQGVFLLEWDGPRTRTVNMYPD